VARIETIDAEVLATLQDDILRPSVVEQAITLALEELSPQRREEDRAAIERELATLRAECERLAEAIGRGGPLDALLERLKSGQERRDELERYSPSLGRSLRLRPSPPLSNDSERSSPTGAAC